MVRVTKSDTVIDHISNEKSARPRWVDQYFSFWGIYDKRLALVDIPRNLELLIETALYALYVAWSPTSKIVLPDNRLELLRAIDKDSESVYVVTPRKFEELVGYVYEQLGCRVQLTNATRDWGADLLAWHPGPFGSESLIVVQTKLYSPEQKITLAGVHGLHGAVTHYNANQGHLVATADVTGAAREFLNQTGYQFIDLPRLRREVSSFFER